MKTEQELKLVNPIRSGGDDGFNMIEVTLAVAVVAVALVAILGLLPVGIESVRRVSDETIIAQLASDLLSLRRTTNYTDEVYIGTNSTVTLAVPRLDTRTTSMSYFDADGIVTNASAGYFRFTAEVKDHPQLVSPDFARLVITVDWPLNPATQQPAANANRKIFVGQFARYQ